MSVDAIKEHLLKAVGVGVALVDPGSLKLVFLNPRFAEWFGDPTVGDHLSRAVPALDADAMQAALAGGGAYRTELSTKPRRRTLVLAVTVSSVESGDGRLLVLECENITRVRELEAMIESYSRMVERNARDLQREKERVEKLLLNIMPREAYEEFKAFGVVTPQLYTEVSVLMLDFVGFTQFSAETDPTVTLSELNDIFTAFDRISDQYGCERIKTIGDGYLAVCGMPTANPDHRTVVARCAVRFLRYLDRRNATHQFTWRARIGLASGKVVGSVVGVQRYVYDVFGPAVNMASRLQTFADPMTVVAHADMRDMLVDEFRLTDLGEQEIRGFGREGLIRVEPSGEEAGALL